MADLEDTAILIQLVLREAGYEIDTKGVTWRPNRLTKTLAGLKHLPPCVRLPKTGKEGTP